MTALFVTKRAFNINAVYSRELQEKLQNWLTKDRCLWYDDIVQALCERGSVFLLPI